MIKFEFPLIRKSKVTKEYMTEQIKNVIKQEKKKSFEGGKKAREPEIEKIKADYEMKLRIQQATYEATIELKDFENKQQSKEVKRADEKFREFQEKLNKVHSLSNNLFNVFKRGFITIGDEYKMIGKYKDEIELLKIEND